MSDQFNDTGWGCAYRSIQTIFSWLWEQTYIQNKVPTLPEIQSALDSIDTTRIIKGTKQWLGTM